ncbi:MAG: sulfurtransferase complex subunit TusB [Gammaproteobacteria bacterium]|nr:sulfurtransferase complex subunit TusB [Gammaproteobacteria bacterium]
MTAMTLHILSASPHAGPSFDLCRRALAPGDTLLLLCDGVYAALQDGACAQQLDALAATVAVYAIGDDCVARGISGRLLPVVRATDYPGFVDLACRHPRSVSWF